MITEDNAIDPMTKIGIMLAIRELARAHGAKTPQAALEWALARQILAPRSGIILERGHDDLVLTPRGRMLVARFWLDREHRRLMMGKGPVLKPTRPHGTNRRRR